MDSLTQIALGATVGAVGFRSRLGRWSIIWGGFCGLAPDLDLVLSIGDSWGELVHHRAESHSLFVLAAIAPLMGLIGWYLSKRQDKWLRWSHLSFWALLSHPLLDAFTTYGTQLFAPFDRTRVALDGVSIIDPVYSIPVFIVMGLGLRRTFTRRGRNFAIVVLIFTTLYLGLGLIQSQRAIAVANAQLASEGSSPLRVRAVPTIGNNQLFRIVVVEEERIRVGFYSHIAPAPIAFHDIPRPPADWRRALAEDRRGALFNWFSDGMVSFKEDGDSALLADQRLGFVAQPTLTIFQVRATRDPSGELQLEMVGRMASDITISQEFGTLWNLLVRGTP